LTNPPSTLSSIEISVTFSASIESSVGSSDGVTNPPSTDSGGGIFFDFPNPIVVIITDDKIIKNTKLWICFSVW